MPVTACPQGDRSPCPRQALLLALATTTLATLALPAMPARAAPSPLPESAAEQRAVASPQDRSFLNYFLEASLAAAEAGHLAAQRAALLPVRQLGGQLRATFDSLRQQLTGMVSPLPLPPLPEAPAAGQVAALDRLRQAGADDFDRQYLAQQLDDQARLLRLLEIEAGTGDNPDIKAFANAQLAQLRAIRQQTLALAGTLPPTTSAGANGD